MGFGIRIGYWPCRKGPYLQCTFLFWHLEVWHGYPSWQQVVASEF